MVQPRKYIMNYAKILKYIHISGTGWLIISSIFLVIVSLRQAGMDWWVIFSLSGHSTSMIIFAAVVYAFAVFENISTARTISQEHPVTSSILYMIIYDATPFIGVLAGILYFGELTTPAEKIISAANGSLGLTFITWIILDPAISFFETLLPESRIHRKNRIAEEKAVQLLQEEDNKRLLKTLLEREERNRADRQRMIEPMAYELVELIIQHDAGKSGVEGHVVEIGAKAWQIGGIECMKQLHETAINIYHENNPKAQKIDFITRWWDGIGNWQKPRIS